MAGAHCLTLSVCLTFVCFFVSAAVGDSCVECAFVVIGDKTAGSECVTDPLNNEQTINGTCNFTTHNCEIWAVYAQGYSRILSLTRSCSVKKPNRSNGCDGTYPVFCEFYCATDGCNVIDGDLHKKFSGDGPSNGGGGTGSASTVRAFYAAGGLAMALYSLALGSVVGI